MWACVGVVAVDDGGGSGVVRGVGVCLLAACVCDGGGRRVFWVSCFPVVGGGGVGE